MSTVLRQLAEKALAKARSIQVPQIREIGTPVDENYLLAWLEATAFLAACGMLGDKWAENLVLNDRQVSTFFLVTIALRPEALDAATRSYSHFDAENHRFFTIFVFAAAVYSCLDLGERKESWRRIQETHTKGLLSTGRISLAAHELAASLQQETSVLGKDYPIHQAVAAIAAAPHQS
ncbi:MAG: hypothetical protein V1716_03845 [Candidatus Uhrbacteria bacterium]